VVTLPPRRRPTRELYAAVKALARDRVAAAVGLKRAPKAGGRMYACPACPGSDALSLYGGGFKCHSCGTWFSNVDLAMAAWGLEKEAACLTLADRLGVYVPDAPQTTPRRGPEKLGGKLGAQLARNLAKPDSRPPESSGTPLGKTRGAPAGITDGISGEINGAGAENNEENNDRGRRRGRENTVENTAKPTAADRRAAALAALEGVRAEGASASDPPAVYRAALDARPAGNRVPRRDRAPGGRGTPWRF